MGGDNITRPVYRQAGVLNYVGIVSEAGARDVDLVDPAFTYSTSIRCEACKRRVSSWPQ